ncbi:uncharacterized protein SCODWIG_03719 [Saccharomycodes ludwigii]|uniref:Uncharacterized protein n=1 Tax=Saccharomycodes ludwigii TaxID=36035 RepID=A0A376BB97_9ASCO|nr:hypothetical protein SCDLUD_000678 [Saccharomycodes ludwigii]KAH3903067.1 hypothetical protein SCDLUD_000678 [Saccharomycodes ludwigii]SSD61958.1 uncharacterized protein SCODWIG_03719 [Saccharomycodes ludwigii]
MTEAKDSQQSTSFSLDEYYKLLKEDPQLQNSLKSIQRYKKTSNDPDPFKRVKKTRHNILTVDENNKINYENIRLVPGSFGEYTTNDYNTTLKNETDEPSSQQEQTNSATTNNNDDSNTLKLYNKISSTKIKNYKQQLVGQNDTFLSIPVSPISSDGDNININIQDNTEETQALLHYINDLQKMHTELIDEYRQVKHQQLNWFLKKELMLDANMKLDLYSIRDILTDQLTVDNKSITKSEVLL